MLPPPIRWILCSRTGPAQSSQVLVTSVLLLAVNVGTGILAARTLGPQGRGELAAITIWPQTVVYMATLGIPGAVVYNLRTSPESGSEVLAVAALLSSLLGALAVAVGLTIAVPVTVAHYGQTVLREAQLLMLTAPAGLFGLVAIGALQSRLEFRKINAIVLGAPVLSLLALGTLAATHLLTPLSAALATILPAVAVTALATAYLLRRYPLTRRGLKPWFGRLLGYGVRAYPVDLVGTLAASIDQAIVVGLVGPAALGLYVVALRGSRMVNLFQQAVAPVLFSRGAGRPLDEVVALTGRSLRVTMFVTTLGALLVGFSSTQILDLAYGHAYLPATDVFRVLLLEGVLSGVVWILGQAFLALGRPGTVAVFQSLGLVALIGLLFVLVPHFGILGAGLALLISTSLRLLLMMAAYPLILGVRLPNFVLQREDMGWVREAFESGRAS